MGNHLSTLTAWEHSPLFCCHGRCFQGWWPSTQPAPTVAAGCAHWWWSRWGPLSCYGFPHLWQWSADWFAKSGRTARKRRFRVETELRLCLSRAQPLQPQTQNLRERILIKAQAYEWKTGSLTFPVPLQLDDFFSSGRLRVLFKRFLQWQNEKSLTFKTEE